LPVNADNRIDM